jgi:hypothetical protein
MIAVEKKQASKATLTKIFKAAGIPQYTGKADGLTGFMIHEDRHLSNSTIISYEISHRNAGWEWQKSEMINQLVAELAIAGGFHVTETNGSVKVWKGEAA